MPPMAAMKSTASEHAYDFKMKDGIARDSHTGELLRGKQVLRPVRFFVSAPWLSCNLE